MIGLPVRLLARAAARWTFSTFGREPRLIRGALDEGRLDARPLDPVLDLVDEDVRKLILVAVEERLRQVVVGVDPGGEHDLETALVRDPLAELGIAVEEHGARLHHGPDPMALDRVRVRDGDDPIRPARHRGAGTGRASPRPWSGSARGSASCRAPRHRSARSRSRLRACFASPPRWRSGRKPSSGAGELETREAGQPGLEPGTSGFGDPDANEPARRTRPGSCGRIASNRPGRSPPSAPSWSGCRRARAQAACHRMRSGPGHWCRRASCRRRRARIESVTKVTGVPGVSHFSQVRSGYCR